MDERKKERKVQIFAPSSSPIFIYLYCYAVCMYITYNKSNVYL